LAWEVGRAENSSDIIHRNSIVPVVLIHVRNSKECRLVAVGAVPVWKEAKTIFRENTLKLESARKDVIWCSIVVGRKELESVRIRPIVVVGHVEGPPTAVCPSASIVILGRTVPCPAETAICERNSQWVVYVDYIGWVLTRVSERDIDSV
jgi:hypothetical protein